MKILKINKYPFLLFADEFRIHCRNIFFSFFLLFHRLQILLPDEKLEHTLNRVRNTRLEIRARLTGQVQVKIDLIVVENER